MGVRARVGAAAMRLAQRNDVLYRAVIITCRTMFRILAIDFDMRGEAGLPWRGPAVIASNHIGFLDFAFVGLAADRRGRRIRFLAKRGSFRHRISGPLMRAMRHVPVDRGSGSTAFRTARQLLGEGELVGLFPEATISRAWTLKPFQPGAAAMAVIQHVPLIPVVLWGGHRLMTVDGHRSARRHMPVDIWVGAPIEPRADWRLPGLARQRAVQAAEAELRRRMAELLDRAQREYRETPRNDADRWWLPRHLGGSAPTPEEAAVIDAARMLD